MVMNDGFNSDICIWTNVFKGLLLNNHLTVDAIPDGNEKLFNSDEGAIKTCSVQQDNCCKIEN